MRKTILIGLITILIGLISCKKDKETNPDDLNSNNDVVYDTIKPLDYFPAYPGSYWIYDNNDTLKVADHYEKYIFNSADYASVPKYDTLILPKLILNGIYNDVDTFAYVKENSISKKSNSNYRDPAFQELFNVNEGGQFVFQGHHAGTSHYVSGYTFKTDTTMIINNIKYNNVLITIHYDNYWMESPINCGYMKEYYAKDVGLIKRESRNYPTDTLFTVDFELIKYKIKNR